MCTPRKPFEATVDEMAQGYRAQGPRTCHRAQRIDVGTGVCAGGCRKRNEVMILDDMKKASRTTNGQNVRENSTQTWC